MARVVAIVGAASGAVAVRPERQHHRVRAAVGLVQLVGAVPAGGRAHDVGEAGVGGGDAVTLFWVERVLVAIADWCPTVFSRRV